MDLPAELRQNIEALEKTIQAHADASRPFSTRADPSAQLEKIESKLYLLEEKMAAYASHHAHQSSRISALKKATSGHWRYSESVARTIEASRLADPRENGKMLWSRAFAPNDPTASHFYEVLLEMEQQLAQAEQVYETIKKQIEPLTNGSEGVHSPSESLKIILKNEQDMLSVLSRRYSQLKEELEAMRKSYRAFCVKYRNDSRDPFVSRVEKPAESKPVSAAGQLPAQPVPSASAAVAGMASGFNPPISTSSSGLTSLLPSATTGLAPVRPASSLFGGFSFGGK